MKRTIKKVFCLVLVVIMILGVIPMNYMATYAISSANPFLQVIEKPDASAIVIKTPAELAAIGNDMYGSYVLANDIDMSSYGNWTPIGKLTASPFKGKFDGQGHSILGLTVNVSIDSASLTNPAHGVGLFGICDGAVIKNVALEDVNISIKNTSGYEYTNVKINGRNIYAGAIAGYMYNESVIYNSYASGTITATASGESEGASAGGLVGYSKSAIVSYSYSNCEVTAKSQNQMYSAPSNAGGIIGLSEDEGYIDKCYNTGDVISITADFGDSVAGGLIGKNTSNGFSITDSFNEGSVTSNVGNLFSESAYAGGIAGYYSGLIKNTYNAGTVYSYGTSVVGEDKAYAAGICGSAQNNASISNSAIVVSSVSAQGSSKTFARIANGGSKSNNISISSYASGSSLDATEYISESVLKSAAPYVNDLSWDFDNVWQMSDNKDFPQLQQVLDSDTQYKNNYIQQHVAFINGETYADILNNKRWASIYWSKEYCGSNNGWYTGLNAFGDFASFNWGELFKEENLFPLILADYINNQGIADKITELTKIALPFNLDKKYTKAKSFIKKYWDQDQFGELSDEDIFYLFHYDEKTSEEWINSNFPEGLEYIVYDTKHEGEWFTDVLDVTDEVITSVATVKDKINSVIDYVNNCMEVSASIETFLTTSDEFKEILQTMYNNIDTSFSQELSHLFGFDLKEQSVTKLRDSLQSYVDFISTSKEGMRAELWARYAITAEAEKIMDEIKDSIITKTVEWFTDLIGSKAVAVLKALGWLSTSTAKLMDFLTNEKELEQYRALLQANSIFENAMFKAIGEIESRFIADPTFENAKLFDASFKFLKETEIYSMNILVKYLDTYQTSYWTSINNMSNSTKATEIEEVLINRRALYNTLCHGTEYSLGGKIITIACPTDISLVDEDNTEVVSIVSDNIICIDNNIDVFVTHGVKYIVVPLEHEYSISITATGEGLMEYSVAEYDNNTQNVQTAIYTNIPLSDGLTFKGNICGEINADESAYNLNSNGYEIEPVFVANKNNHIISPSSLDFSESNIKLILGETYQVVYDISPETVSVDTIIWTTSDETIANVSENGLITALNPGKVTVSGYTFVGGVSDSIEITVINPDELAILTSELPDGYVDYPYSPTQLTATKDNVSWSVIDGVLPTGLLLSENGIISGTPEEEGTYHFSVSATDEQGSSAIESMTILIAGTASAPVLSSMSLPNAIINTPYSAAIVVDAVPTATISLVYGELPDGLSIDKNGLISGVPVTSGEFHFKIAAQNGVLPNAIAEYAIIVENKVLKSGTTGDLSWILYDNGELLFTGNGAPSSYISKQTPWYQYTTEIKRVTFEGDITKIGGYMFEDCVNLTELNIPNSVTTIEEYALKGCTGLSELTIPFVGAERTSQNTYDAVFGFIFGRVSNDADGIVQYFKDEDGSLFGYRYAVPISLEKVNVSDAKLLSFGAFHNCSNIKEINLNDGITSISGYVFNGDSSLKSLVIPDTVETIDEFALNGCSSIETLTIPFVGASRNITNDYTAVLGFIFGRTNDDGTKQYFKLSDGSLYSYTYAIPGTLKSVTITDDSSIALAAFSNCTFLKEIILEEATSQLENFVIYGIDSIDRFEIQNRNCSIVDDYNAFSISGTIYGYSGSTSQTFASEKNIAFIPLDEAHTHTWNDGEITKAATCTEEGVKTFTCAVCGETRTESVEKTAHTSVVIPAVAATCKSTGLTEGSKCSVCGEILVAQEVTSKIAHTWNDGEITKAATCTEEGVKTFTCAVCGETRIDAIHALGHTDSDNDGFCDNCEEKVKHDDPTKNCSCNCHKSGFMGFIYKIQRFFWKLFGIHKTCNCGIIHY